MEEGREAPAVDLVVSGGRGRSKSIKQAQRLKVGLREIGDGNG